MKNLKSITVVLTFGILLCASCEKESVNPDDGTINGISKEVLNKISELYFNPGDVEKRTYTDVDGTAKEMYIIEGDIVMSYDQLMNMDIAGGVQTRQYRTTNLVSTPKTIKVVGYNGNNNFGISSSAQTGLQYAVSNFNNLNLSLKMELVFSTSFDGDDVVVYTSSDLPSDSIRGEAGFPSNGQPFTRVKINLGANASFDVQTLEGLMTHELGHCVGLRHTDWNTRKSCGQSGEPVGPDGAMYIPGTAGASNDDLSIMNACFPNVQGEFSDNDKIALNYLY